MFFNKRFYKIKKKLDRIDRIDQLEKRISFLESRYAQNSKIRKSRKIWKPRKTWKSCEIWKFPLYTPIGPVTITAKIFRP